MAFEDKSKALFYIQGLRASDSMQDDFVASYLDYIYELASSPDKEAFLRKADKKMTEFMRSLLVSKVSEKAVDMLKRFTKLAVKNDPSALPLINQARDMMEKDDSSFTASFLDFLIGLMGARDRKAYLDSSDEELVHFMSKMLTE